MILPTAEQVYQIIKVAAIINFSAIPFIVGFLYFSKKFYNRRILKIALKAIIENNIQPIKYSWLEANLFRERSEFDFQEEYAYWKRTERGFLSWTLTKNFILRDIKREFTSEHFFGIVLWLPALILGLVFLVIYTIYKYAEYIYKFFVNMIPSVEESVIKGNETLALTHENQDIREITKQIIKKENK